MGISNVFDSEVTKATKKKAAADEAAAAARDVANTAAANLQEARTVLNNAHGGVASPSKHLAYVLAERAYVEAVIADEARTAEQTAAEYRLGVAQNDADVVARDPESLLTDLAKIAADIKTQETALAIARQAWGARVDAAHASYFGGGTGGKLPLPTFIDEIGRPRSPADFVADLAASVKNAGAARKNEQREQQLVALAAREKELRATIETQRLTEVQLQADRDQYARHQRTREDESARATSQANDEWETAARAAAAETEKLAAAHRARMT